ncbi:MAG TPA: GAF domain-containing protein [Candidatus Elarobacter sp.]|nr:GAF domain-containing protein [Candidatus Elarobacter sp.]
MQHAQTTPAQGADFELLVAQARALIDGERDPIANAANVTALLSMSVPQVSWIGIYLRRDDELVLGPFQGKPACARIAVGAGVCGAAAAQRRTVVVADVNAFPGHIACDPASRSEIVVPLLAGDELVGVLDVDSAVADRFHDADRTLFEAIAALLVAGSNFARA